MLLPSAFENRMRALLREEYPAFLSAMQEESAVKGLRVNRHKLAPSCFCSADVFPVEPIPYTEDGFYLPEGTEAGKHPYHHAGAYYLQDPGAMATVAALGSARLSGEGLRVLDLCSAPGGKTTQIAAAIEKRGGIVLSNEYNAKRSRILAGNVERMGLTNVCVTNLDTACFPRFYPGYFDIVVADAPCSGEGMFRKNDRAIEEWSESNVLMCRDRQREILNNAALCVAPGGYLLYSTCTYAVEENEETVAAFLASHADFTLVPCDPSVVKMTADGVAFDGCTVENIADCRRFYPHRSPGEGQFVALMQRSPDAPPPRRERSKGGKPQKGGRTAPPQEAIPLPPLDKRDEAEVRKALKELFPADDLTLGLCGGNVVSFTTAGREFLIPLFGVVACGVAIGEWRKGRLIPHHHMFSAYGAMFYRRVTLAPSGEAVEAYLGGEEIDAPTEVRGIVAVTVSLGDAEIALGGGKVSDGKLKNYYPKGLRMH